MAAKSIFSLAGRKIYIAGHNGMVGSALVRRLSLIPCEIDLTASSTELDLRRQPATELLHSYTNKPEVVFVAASNDDGILANDSEILASFFTII